MIFGKDELMKVVTVWLEEDEVRWFNKMDNLLKVNKDIMKYGEVVYNIAINEIYLELNKLMSSESDTDSHYLEDYIADNLGEIIDYDSAISVDELKGAMDFYANESEEKTISLNKIRNLIIDEDYVFKDITDSIIRFKVDNVRDDIYKYLSLKIGDCNKIFWFLTLPEFESEFYTMFQNKYDFNYVDVMGWIDSGFQY